MVKCIDIPRKKGENISEHPLAATFATEKILVQFEVKSMRTNFGYTMAHLKPNPDLKLD